MNSFDENAEYVKVEDEFDGTEVEPGDDETEEEELTDDEVEEEEES